MTNPPPLQPNYLPPEKPQPGSIARKNRWWMVALRVLAGGVAGGGATLLALWIGAATQNWLLGGLPLLVIFTAALFLSIKYKRFGYTSGVIIGPFVVVACIIVFLFIVCSGKVV